MTANRIISARLIEDQMAEILAAFDAAADVWEGSQLISMELKLR